MNYNADLQTPSVESDEADSRIYCVCRKPYADEDEDVVMLGCDSCDNWFHPACIGLDVARLDLIETYICHSCERRECRGAGASDR